MRRRDASCTQLSALLATSPMSNLVRIVLVDLRQNVQCGEIHPEAAGHFVERP